MQPFFCLYVYININQNHIIMNAMLIIQTLMFSRATANKLETATNVLNELYRLRTENKLSRLTIRKAIRMQEKIVKELGKT